MDGVLLRLVAASTGEADPVADVSDREFLFLLLALLVSRALSLNSLVSFSSMRLTVQLRSLSFLILSSRQADRRLKSTGTN